MAAHGEPLVRIGAFARLAGTNLRTLRYYEELGLLRCAKRSRGGFRYYAEAELRRLETVRRLQGMGLALSKIREILDLPKRGARDRSGMLRRASKSLEMQRKLLGEQMARIGGQLRDIESALKHVATCGSCPLLPPLGDPYCDPCRLNGKALPGPFRALLD
ncbi:MAG: MerR family transcriptional regulator [Planctomycetes bacterium]|nr:MerR family transcriptional regulator [Planctomycetota bacterium]